MITLADIVAARTRLGSAIYESPCALSETVSALCDNRVYFKLENLQMTGSFKERGALNKLLMLSADEKARGVIAATAGNHGLALAYHAQRLGVRATVCMPAYAPLAKVTTARGYGAEVILHGADYDEAYAEARRREAAGGFTFVHPFDDPAVIAGQGTIGLELLAQLPELDAVVVPVGGGGLAAGIACAIKENRPAVRVVGVQSAAVPGMKAALVAGKPVTVPPGQTVADGIAARQVGAHAFPLVQRYVDDVVTVEEQDIANAILLLLEREKTVAEGAGAVALAALQTRQAGIAGKRTAVVVSGGNIDVNVLARIIERGLVRSGRLVRLRLSLPDLPGALHRLTGLVAEQRANVLRIEHERAYPRLGLSYAAVECTLETRGPDHIDDLVAALSRAGYQPERIL